MLSGKSVRVQIEVGQRHGVAGRALEELGLTDALLSGIDAMVPAQAVYQHLELVAARADAELVALEIAGAHGPLSLGPVGLAIRAATTGQRALGVLLRYQHLMNTLARINATQAQGALVLTEERPGGTGLGALLASEIAVLSTLHWVRLLFGRSLAPLGMAVPRRGQFARYSEWAGCDVVGGAPQAKLVLPMALLDTPVATADVELAHFFEELLGQRAAVVGQCEGDTLLQDVRHAVAKALPQGTPSLNQLAGQLGTSPRTLQRRLASAGKGFSQVVDEVRHDLALTHLKNPTLGIAEIAFMLGFDEVASLHRAFRRWQGTTPGAFRIAAQKLAGGK
jgi:AraC-like DNA-binding protein